MSTIPDDKIQEVRERTSILEIVGDYVSLRKSGANYQGLCPFHGEKTPSFNVNPAREIFHCFGCGTGGNAFSFIMKIEGLSFPEAVRFLAKRVGVTIEERLPTPQEKRRQDEREALYRVNELAADYYRRVLMKEAAGETGRRYLERRGVDEATAEAYRLGFAPDRWDGLTRHLEQKKALMDAAETVGLIRRKESGGYYDSFRNRLLFTISDIQGRPIGFGGRVLDDTLPKYINSPESPIYHKGEVLFGVHLAKPAMREQGAAIIVEGYFDHLALYQAGVRNVVATCGTALTDGHLKLLQRYAGKLYTLFDSDSAGKKATLRAMELVLAGGMPAYVVELPAGDDPDSFLKQAGGDAFAERVTGALPIFEYFFRDLLRQGNAGTVEGKVRVVEELAPRLQKIANPMERDLYVKEIVRVLGINERALLKKIGGTAISGAELAPAATQRREGGHNTEDMLLALMGKYPEVAVKVSEYGMAELFSADMLPVAEAIIAQSRESGEVDLGLILDHVSSPEERSRLAALFVDDAHLEGDPIRMFDDLRLAREKEALRDINRLCKELLREDPESSRHQELLQQINCLRNKKSQLS